ncbi:EF-hand domain-containing protein [Nafulsella turpanensis]|uniref:hypothetical protein n=1 Tax=Nafulsella turpanensis TaxID=1265690 RepID=UPI00126905DF|nr:hypothetical protein [Nafulsella turpanensis]
MKKLTNETKLSSLLPTKTIGSLLTAGLFLFGAASCGPANEENAVAEDEVYEEPLAEDEAFAEDEALAEGDFNEWDTNDDELWDDNEFETVANDAGLYEGWDEDADGLYSEDEVDAGLFEVYDENDDGFLDEEEYSAWNTAWGGEYEEEFEAWDADADGVLAEDEFFEGTNEADLYEGWDEDGDGLYSDDELEGGLFETWDADDDGYLSDEEYNTIGYNFWGI